jgi:hypothetical protein
MIAINKYNIKFPKDFFHYTDGYIMSNDIIQDWIDQCLNNNDISGISSGDTKVFIEKDDDIINIFVCKNYWEATIFLEDQGK